MLIDIFILYRMYCEHNKLPAPGINSPVYLALYWYQWGFNVIHPVQNEADLFYDWR